MPVYFLAKTLQSLARHGILRSSKGPSGGFRLNRPAAKIRFLDVVEALDGLDGLRNGQNGLPEFAPVRAAILNYLKTMTVADVASARKRKRRKPAAERARPRA